jgi:hypothetical protein
LTANLTDVANYIPQYSRSDFALFDVAKFHDVCLEFEKFLYFVQKEGTHSGVPFDDELLNFEMLKWELKLYLEHKSVNVTRRTCYLVAPLESTTWKLILLTILPLSVSVERNTPVNTRPLFIFRKRVPPAALPLLKLLSPDPPVVLEDIMCFETLLVTNTYSRMSETEDRIQKSLNLDIRPLRKRLPAIVPDPKTVVLSESLWHVLKPKISQRFPDVNVVKLSPGGSLNEVINTVRKASVLIGDHITSLIHLLWMNQYSVVLDLTPADFACNTWAENLSAKSLIQYKSVFQEKECKCPDFSCYPKFPKVPGNYTWDSVLDNLQTVVSRKKGR